MSTLNVLRYSALALGAVVGFKNDFFLKSQAAKKEEEDAFQQKLKLIEQAKAEYAKLNAPKEVKKADTTKIDLEDPNLDYAAVILSAVDSLKQ